MSRSGAVGRVRLVSLSGCDREDDEVDLATAAPSALLESARTSAVVVLQGDVLNRVPGLAALDVPVVVDAYDPFHLEQLEQTRERPAAERQRIVRDCVRALNDQLVRADLVLCASDRQRSMWLGHLAALGRVTRSPTTIRPTSRRCSPSCRSVPRRWSAVRRPTGGPWSAPPFPGSHPRMCSSCGRRRLPVVRHRRAPLAMELLAASHPRVKLLFLGTRHPLRPDSDSPEVAALRARAAGSGLLDRTVFLHPGWVPYDERHDWLGGADVGVSTHHPHLETEFSYRTRVVDYLAAGLPVVTTDGDAMADLVRTTGCGMVVPPHDPAALASALGGLADDALARRAASDRALAAAADLAWDVVAAPLVGFCRAPRRAPDLVAPPATRALLDVGRGGLVRRVRAAAAEGGLALLATRALRRLGLRRDQPTADRRIVLRVRSAQGSARA